MRVGGARSGRRGSHGLSNDYPARISTEKPSITTNQVISTSQNHKRINPIMHARLNLVIKTAAITFSSVNSVIVSVIRL